MAAIDLEHEAYEFEEVINERERAAQAATMQEPGELSTSSEMLADAVARAVDEATEFRLKNSIIRSQPPQLLVRATLGGGKSFATWKKVAEAIFETPEFRILIRAQSQEKAIEIEYDIIEQLAILIGREVRRGGEVSASPETMIHRWIGSNSPDPRDDNTPACQNLALVAEIRKGGGTLETACAAGKGCPFKRQCYYAAQGGAKTANVVILSGDASLSQIPSGVKRDKNKQHTGLRLLSGQSATETNNHFDMVIIDESSVSDLVSGVSGDGNTGGRGIDIDRLLADFTTLHTEASRAVGEEPGYDHAENRILLQKICTVLDDAAHNKRGVSAEDVLCKIDYKVEELRELKRAIWSSKISISKEMKKAIGDAETAAEHLKPLSKLLTAIRPVGRVLTALIEGIEDSEAVGDIDREMPQIEVYTDSGNEDDAPKIRVRPMYRSKLDKKIRDCPTLIIDATGRADALRPWFPRLRLAADIRIEDGVGVFRCQMTDSLMSKSALGVNERDTPDRKARQLRNAARVGMFSRLRDIQTGGDGGIVTVKAARTWLEKQGFDSDGLMHFGNCRGKNGFSNKRHLTVAGRITPGVPSMERLAGVITGETIVPKEDNQLDRVQGAIQMRDGSVRLSLTERHPDENVEMIRASITDDEIEQACGRGRSIRRDADRPLLETILTSVPTRQKIDDTFTKDEFEAGTGWPGALLVGGVWPSSTGSAELRKNALTRLSEHLPWILECTDIPADDVDAKEFFKGKRRSPAVKRLCVDIEMAAVTGGIFDLICQPFDMSDWYRLTIKLAGARAGSVCHVRGDTVEDAISRAADLFEGAEIKYAPIKKREILIGSKNVSGGANPGSYYPPENAPPERKVDPIRNDRHETVDRCFEMFGFVPANASHAAHLAPSVWAGRDNCKKHVTKLIAGAGEIEIRYRHAGAGQRKTKARAIVRADSREQGAAVLLKQWSDAEII